MTRRGPKKKPKPQEPIDPASLQGLKVLFFDWMKEMHRSPNTLRTRGNALEFFLRWCNERGLLKPAEINRPILEYYRKHIYQYRQRNGKPLSLKTQIQRLIAIRVFFKWMARHHHILYNPASELEIPRTDKKLPSNVLSVQEVETVINQTDVGEPLGIRDRAVLETLYSTGIRRGELIGLRLYDLSLDRGTVMVRGKGNKERVVPIGDRAMAWLDKYLLDVRPTLVHEPDDGTVFLTIDGDAFSPNRLSDLARGYVQQAEVGKDGSCHIFRHAMATHMLEAGADIRIIQAILGHEALTTTEIYTRVSIAHIKAVHEKTHPARLARSTIAPGTADNAEKLALLDVLANEVDQD